MENEENRCSHHSYGTRHDFQTASERGEYDKSMMPKQWFQEWARMFLVANEDTHVSDQYQMACIINSLIRVQLHRFMFRSESDTTLEELNTVF